MRTHQPSGWDRIPFFEVLNLYWTSPESGAPVVQINGKRWSYSDGCWALSGRLKFTVRRHKLNKDSLTGQEVATEYAVGDIDSPEAVVAFCQANKVPKPRTRVIISQKVFIQSMSKSRSPRNSVN